MFSPGPISGHCGADPNARIEPLDISPREAAHAIERPTMIGILEQHGPTRGV